MEMNKLIFRFSLISPSFFIVVILMGKPPVIPVSSVSVFKFENSLVPASRDPTPVIPVFYIIFHINLTKKCAGAAVMHIWQELPAGATSRHN
jgi:hypothetical protein